MVYTVPCILLYPLSSSGPLILYCKVTPHFLSSVQYKIQCTRLVTRWLPAGYRVHIVYGTHVNISVFFFIDGSFESAGIEARAMVLFSKEKSVKKMPYRL